MRFPELPILLSQTLLFDDGCPVKDDKMSSEVQPIDSSADDIWTCAPEPEPVSIRRRLSPDRHVHNGPEPATVAQKIKISGPAATGPVALGQRTSGLVALLTALDKSVVIVTTNQHQLLNMVPLIFGNSLIGTGAVAIELFYQFSPIEWFPLIVMLLLTISQHTKNYFVSAGTGILALLLVATMGKIVSLVISTIALVLLQ